MGKLWRLPGKPPTHVVLTMHATWLQLNRRLGCMTGYPGHRGRWPSVHWQLLPRSLLCTLACIHKHEITQHPSVQSGACYNSPVHAMRVTATAAGNACRELASS